jgi:acyl carrier protein
MMSSVDSIETALVDYLQADHVAWEAFGVETDLIESGWLDSLLVLDLVRFVQSRFAITMTPGDITPGNLRSVKCLARYITGKLTHTADAA